LPADQFAKTWIPQKLGWKNVRIEDSESWPDLLPKVRPSLALLAAQNNLTLEDFEITTARTTICSDLKRARVRQHVFTTTIRPGPRSRTWHGMKWLWVGYLLGYYHAPESEFAAAQTMLAGIADSLRLDPDWHRRYAQKKAAKEAKEQAEANAAAAAWQQAMAQNLHQQAMASNLHSQQLFMQTQQHIYDNQNAVNDMIIQGGQYHSAGQDHAMHQWSNATLGVTDLVNPSTGTVYQVANDHDRYWRTNDGYIIGGSWGTQPDPSWQQLKPFKV